MRKTGIAFGTCLLTMALLGAACVAPEPDGEPVEQFPAERAMSDPAQAREEPAEPDATPTVRQRGEPLPRRGVIDERRLPEPVPSPEETATIGEAPQELVGAIIADLAERTGVAHTAVEVLRAEAVVWNDGSLGCPQPGIMYTQALVNGYRVVLGYDDKEFDYRAGNRGFFFLCERRLPLRVVPPPGGTPDQ